MRGRWTEGSGSVGFSAGSGFGFVVVVLRAGGAVGPACAFVWFGEVLAEILVAAEDAAEAVGGGCADEEGHDGDHGHFAEAWAAADVGVAALVVVEDRGHGEAEDGEENQVREVEFDHGGGAGEGGGIVGFRGAAVNPMLGGC